MGRRGLAVLGAAIACLAVVCAVVVVAVVVVPEDATEPAIDLPAADKGPNRRPRWTAPADRTRFDLEPGGSASFAVGARDPDGDEVTVTRRFFDAEGTAVEPPGFVTCTPDADAGPAVRISCRVAPTEIEIAVMEVRAGDDRGAMAPPRRYLVSGSLRTYLALGDSYAAGEGVDPYFRDGVDLFGEPADNRCHRSSRAYATDVRLPGGARSVYELSSEGPPGTGTGAHKFGSDRNVRSREQRWSFWACSGASTADVTTTAPGDDATPQLANRDIDPGVDLVTISIGGNDIGFANVLERCGAPPLQDNRCLDGEIDGKPFVEGLRARIAALRSDLVDTYEAIDERTFDAPLLVLGYPQVFPETAAEQRCVALRAFDFTTDEQDALRALGVELNDVIRSAARQVGATFVDVAAAFAGHEVCGRDGEWINGVSSTLRAWPPVDDESFHPKLAGQMQMGNLVNAELGS